ncbi:hypothetical protein ACFE04_026878 [Oxalis oulophora]
MSDTGGDVSFTRTVNSRRRRLRIQRVKYTCKRKEMVVSHGHGGVSIIGGRKEMEDAVRMELGFMTKGEEKYDFFGVYDGHGGAFVAEACKDRLHKVLVEVAAAAGNVNIIHDDEWETLMIGCFEKMDEEVNDQFPEVGSTAVVAVLGKEELVVANCGDSRAVISRNGVLVPLSVDHKRVGIRLALYQYRFGSLELWRGSICVNSPDRADEYERIEAAGGKVVQWSGPRVLGILATSRSIGDKYLKPFVIPKPEVRVCKRTDSDEFLILASDGLWDVVSNDRACDIVRKCLNGEIRKKSLHQVYESRAAEAAALLSEVAISLHSNDNISVIVVDLTKPAAPSFSLTNQPSMN